MPELARVHSEARASSTTSRALLCRIRVGAAEACMPACGTPGRASRGQRVGCEHLLRSATRARKLTVAARSACWRSSLLQAILPKRSATQSSQPQAARCCGAADCGQTSRATPVHPTCTALARRMDPRQVVVDHDLETAEKPCQTGKGFPSYFGASYSCPVQPKSYFSERFVSGARSELLAPRYSCPAISLTTIL